MSFRLYIIEQKLTRSSFFLVVTVQAFERKCFLDRSAASLAILTDTSNETELWK